MSQGSMADPPEETGQDGTRQRLQVIFREVLDEPDLVLIDELTAADVEGWDSLAHLGLMFSIESEFGITFTDREMSTLQDVGELRRVVQDKTAA